MTRSPVSLAAQQLQTQLARTRRQLRRRTTGYAAERAMKAVSYELEGVSRRQLVPAYNVSATSLFAASYERTLRDIPERTANMLLKASAAAERATAGHTQAQKDDNQDIKEIMERFAKAVNREIYEEYIESFSGRSYRVGDPSRRSGALEEFLRRNIDAGLIARPEGQGVEIDLSAAVNDADVPHIFRLNYGTKSLKGAEKTGPPPPVFSVTLISGAPTKSQTLVGERRPGFKYPGGAFPYKITGGPGGSARLFYMKGMPVVPLKKSRGIAPSYFVERGIAAAAETLPEEYKALLAKWRDRVHRLRDQSGSL